MTDDKSLDFHPGDCNAFAVRIISKTIKSGEKKKSFFFPIRISFPHKDFFTHKEVIDHVMPDEPISKQLSDRENS